MSDSSVQGVLQKLQQGGGFLRDPARSFQPGSDDVWVSSQLMRQYGLVEGAVVDGTASKGAKGMRLETVETICGLGPEAFRSRRRFDRLQAISPEQRFRLGDSGNVTMRIVELIAPIGKGTRGMIVAPPKTGKTRILEEIAAAIRFGEPDARIVVLLVDERPEEVTHFRRNVDAEVLASSSDQKTESHVNLVELVLAQVRCELECGRDVVVLVDSLTRLSRAFNRHGTRQGRTLSGGLGTKALEIPRRFFGLARNVEGGGSVTVIATALVETGSRMDDLIFEEFKGTGNSEIVLDRGLAESRIFPAINIRASGTRREELLYNDQEMDALARLHRRLADKEPKDAMLAMLELIQGTRNNAELLQQLK